LRTGPDWSGLVLKMFRCCLVSATASSQSIGEIQDVFPSAAYFAYWGAQSDAKSVDSASRPAGGITEAAAKSALSAIRSASVSAGYNTSRATRSGTLSAARSALASSAYKRLSLDPSVVLSHSSDRRFLDNYGKPDSLMETSLFSADRPPDVASEQWQKLREALQDAGGDWGFWFRWYEAHWHGERQTWEMLRDVAVSPKIDWEAGYREVLADIAAIEAKYLANNLANNLAEDLRGKTPSSDGVEVDDQTEKLREVLRDLDDARLYQTGLELQREPAAGA